jgi:uncharacterized protein involved in response to NO
MLREVALGAARFCARVFGPLLFPTAYLPTLVVAGGLWTAAFLVFLIVYAPVLSRPRIDGRGG